MLSRSSIYALQAALYLAQQDPDITVSASSMARDLKLPANYLAKVLRRLGREGILTSTRGVRGGYRLVASPRELSVEDVVAPFEELRIPEVCLLGGPCSEDEPCAAHTRRLEWGEARRKILRRTRLIDLLEEPERSGVDGETAASAHHP